MKPPIYAALWKAPFAQCIDLKILLVHLQSVRFFWFQVAELILWILTFRAVSCHSQPCQQCPHQHQCDLWWARARDVLQACGACARSSRAQRPVPDVWCQQCQPQRQVSLLFRRTLENWCFLKWGLKAPIIRSHEHCVHLPHFSLPLALQLGSQKLETKSWEEPMFVFFSQNAIQYPTQSTGPITGGKVPVFKTGENITGSRSLWT